MTFLSIYQPRRLGRLLLADAQNVSRDPIMMIMIILSFVAPVLFGIYQSDLNQAAFAQFKIINIAQYVAVVTIIMPAFMIGWVTGFLMLEDRDDGPLLAMETTPIGKTGFIIYRATVSIVICFIVTILCAQLVFPEMSILWQLYLALMVGFEGTIVAFILLALARNKVEGLALSKLINIGSLIPLLAIFASSWRYLGGVFPTFWMGEFFELSPSAMSPISAAIIGLIMHIVWIVMMFEIIRRRVG